MRFIILRRVIGFILPFMVVYAIYIQLNGEVSPGGGFQGGVIFATAIVAYDFIIGVNFDDKMLDSLIITSVIGILIMFLVGVLGLIFSSYFMDYSTLSNNPVSGQQIGIFVFELGVGITVFSTISKIYFLISSIR